MKFHIVIPAHNEEDYIGLTLQSLVTQTLLPKLIVVVNDNSTDSTKTIVEQFAKDYNFIKLVNSTSSNNHLPGTKIVNAFYKGFETLDKDYDVICKYDADLIFPSDYLEKLAAHFSANPKLGMAAGFCYIEKNNSWIREGITGKDHIRGALKAYTKGCFQDIGGLKKSIGWDTVDEILANYYGWTYLLDSSLHVKHLKPTGASYNNKAKYIQGEALYKMRLGPALTFLSALKRAFAKRSIPYFFNTLIGYTKATIEKPAFIMDKDQGKFFRKLRWKGVKKALFK